jgi:hypothetical protein
MLPASYTAICAPWMLRERRSLDFSRLHGASAGYGRTINVRAPASGRRLFFGDFREQTRGVLVVQ